MLKDLRAATRSLARHPAFTIAVVAVLTLGIGANVAVFGLLDQVLLAPPGVSEPARVVSLSAHYTRLNLPRVGVSPADFQDLRAERTIFERVAASDRYDATHVTAGQAASLQVARVSSEWFDVFGARPMAGRAFTRDEVQGDGPPVVMLPYTTWQGRFGGDAAIVGQTITLDGQLHMVVGIMPRSFRQPRTADLWKPLRVSALQAAQTARFANSLSAVARLKAGVSVAAADARLRGLAGRVLASHDGAGFDGKSAGWGLHAEPFTDVAAGRTKRPMLMLFGAVACVLLVACSNAAGLMLARAIERTREVAVRSALGAGRWQLIRQALVESLIVGALGAAGGLLAGGVGMQALIAIAPEGTAVGLVPALDARVALFAVAIALAAAALCSLAPAWHATRTVPVESLKAAARTASGNRRGQRLRTGLVVAETAMAMVLLVGAGLLVRSLLRMQSVEPGFNGENLVVGRVALPTGRYRDAGSLSNFFRSAVDQLQQSPSVVSAAMASPLPFSGSDRSSPFEIEGRPVAPGAPVHHGRLRAVTPNYFKTLGIPLRDGRLLASSDAAGRELVVVIDERLKQRFWPAESPIGDRVRFGSALPWMTIVGVAGDVRHSSLVEDDDRGSLYQCLYQWPQWSQVAWLVARLEPGAGDARSVLAGAIRVVDPNLAVQQVSLMEERILLSLGPQRFVAMVLLFFAATALALAAVGLYGVVSCSVSQRVPEIGIRIALGADRVSVQRLVLGQGAAVAALGVAIGTLASPTSTSWA